VSIKTLATFWAALVDVSNCKKKIYEQQAAAHAEPPVASAIARDNPRSMRVLRPKFAFRQCRSGLRPLWCAPAKGNEVIEIADQAPREAWKETCTALAVANQPASVYN